MKSVLTETLIIGLTLGLLSCGTGCHSVHPGCSQYENHSPEATCCRLVRIAVWEYVDAAQSDADRFTKVESIRRLLDHLRERAVLDSVLSVIARDSLAPGFAPIFEHQLRQACQPPIIDPKARRNLLMSGLRHGLNDWADSLGLDS